MTDTSLLTAFHILRPLEVFLFIYFQLICFLFFEVNDLKETTLTFFNTWCKSANIFLCLFSACALLTYYTGGTGNEYQDMLRFIINKNKNK